MDLFNSSTVIFSHDRHKWAEFTDNKFPQKFVDLATCDFSEIVKVCYDECKEVTNTTSSLVCP
ncbi:hypothetical protein PFISCL1PPCAC_11205, partial [Pristionchus fissidentatus]